MGQNAFIGKLGTTDGYRRPGQEKAGLKQQLYSGAGLLMPPLTLKTRIAQLEKDNRELRLYLAALVRYLGRKGVLQQDEFCSLVEVVDSEDGTKDGGYTGKIMK